MSVNEAVVFSNLILGSYEGFWEYCKRRCRSFREGCAIKCGLRKQLRIPPHGRTYKFRGIALDGSGRALES